jgi:hypothetical protein
MSTTETPRIVERVKFWEEQDRINKSIIPRILKNHDLIMDITKQVSSFSEVIAKYESKLIAVEKSSHTCFTELSTKVDKLNVQFESIAKQIKNIAAPSKLPLILSITAILSSVLSIIIAFVK